MRPDTAAAAPGEVITLEDERTVVYADYACEASGIVAELPRGSTVTLVIHDVLAGVMRVRLPDGQNGFLRAKPLGAPAPQSDAGNAAVETATVDYNRTLVFAGPLMESSGAIAELPRGTVVTVLRRDQAAGVVRVRLADGVEGWVKAMSLAAGVPQPRAAQPAAGAGQAAATVRAEMSWINKDGSALWSRPEGEPRNVVANLPYGTRVTVLLHNELNGSARVNTESGTEGWVNDRVLSIREPPRYHDRGEQPPNRLGVETGYPARYGGSGYARGAGETPPRAWLGRWLFLGGAAAMLLCSFLPWLSGDYQSVNLAQMSKTGDGAVTEVVIIALVAGLGAVLRLTGVLKLMPARIWAAIGAGLGLAEFFYINSEIEKNLRYSSGVSHQFGYYLLLIAALTIAVSIFVDTDG